MKFIIGLILGGALTIFLTHYDYSDARFTDLASFIQTFDMPSMAAEKPSISALPEPALAEIPEVMPEIEQELMPELIPELTPEVMPEVLTEALPEIAGVYVGDPFTFAEPESGSAVVWTAFRSEASATGFARHLTNAINHPFSVTRVGPGNYQVSYAFTDTAEADRLAEQVELITGAK